MGSRPWPPSRIGHAALYLVEHEFIRSSVPVAPLLAADARQERPQPSPLGIRQITPPHTHINDPDAKHSHDRTDKS
ncbi:hypothetical protein [Streptomyces sp. NPDC001657]|uniref:hypothetical protein n=1 Tax=Streptomyces sp. NPDC001657 TaxID=3154522 RepID=UPI00331FFEE1